MVLATLSKDRRPLLWSRSIPNLEDLGLEVKGLLLLLCLKFEQNKIKDLLLNPNAHAKDFPALLMFL